SALSSDLQREAPERRPTARTLTDTVAVSHSPEGPVPEVPAPTILGKPRRESPQFRQVEFR
ncbi:MAG TPA: hypothetical protein VHL52_14005, partial [Acidimicrobiia bacterium]|nr:hypothetical protein [Acidimicrobiia bacterium]